MSKLNTKELKKAAKKMKKEKGLLSEFKTFIMRGNVIDLAVGVIIGGAFQKIVTSVVEDIFMPLISLITSLLMGPGTDFTNLFIALDGKKYETLAAATEAEVAVIRYGDLISNVLDFLIMALVIFFLVKGINKLSNMTKKEPEAVVAEPTEKTCPYCMSQISIKASRCPLCTSQLPEPDTQEMV